MGNILLTVHSGSIYIYIFFDKILSQHAFNAEGGVDSFSMAAAPTVLQLQLQVAALYQLCLFNTLTSIVSYSTCSKGVQLTDFNMRRDVIIDTVNFYCTEMFI